MKFKSVLEMVKKLSSNSFYNKWVGNWPRRIIENYQFDPVTCRSSYQGYCRFYLDDYKEQEELRKEWFGINHPKALFVHSSCDSVVFGCNVTEFTDACEKMAKVGQEIYDNHTKLLLFCEGNDDCLTIPDTNDFEFSDIAFEIGIFPHVYHSNPFRKREHEFKNEKLIEEVLYQKEVNNALHGTGICLHIIQNTVLDTGKSAVYAHFQNRFMRRN